MLICSQLSKLTAYMQNLEICGKVLREELLACKLGSLEAWHVASTLTASERLQAWVSWLEELLGSTLDLKGTPTWLLPSNMKQLRALADRADKVMVLAPM